MGIESLLVLLLVLSPGVIADSFYRLILWRRVAPEEHLRLTRVTLFSAAGLLLAFSLAELIDPLSSLYSYLTSAWWDSWEGGLHALATIAGGWLLHTAGASAAAATWAYLIGRRSVGEGVRKLLGQSMHHSAWAEFADTYVGDWVSIKLADGRHLYAQLGIISGDGSKDLLVWNPYPFDPDKNTFEVTGARGMFIPASQLVSVTVPEPKEALTEKRKRFGIYKLATGERIGGEGRSGIQQARQELAIDGLRKERQPQRAAELESDASDG